MSTKLNDLSPGTRVTVTDTDPFEGTFTGAVVEPTAEEVADAEQTVCSFGDPDLGEYDEGWVMVEGVDFVSAEESMDGADHERACRAWAFSDDLTVVDVAGAR
jgi:hypothetical protein